MDIESLVISVIILILVGLGLWIVIMVLGLIASYWLLILGITLVIATLKYGDHVAYSIKKIGIFIANMIQGGISIAKALLEALVSIMKPLYRFFKESIQWSKKNFVNNN